MADHEVTIDSTDSMDRYPQIELWCATCRQRIGEPFDHLDFDEAIALVDKHRQSEYQRCRFALGDRDAYALHFCVEPLGHEGPHRADPEEWAEQRLVWNPKRDAYTSWEQFAEDEPT